MGDIMINRDENGKVISADSISDITDELSEIESLMNKTVKKGPEGLDEEEKNSLISKIDDMNILINIATDEIKKGGNPMALLGFLKQVMKIKSAAEKFKDTFGDITAQ